jgi:thymidylate synthase (FAD)
MKEEFYLPKRDDIRYQSATNRQGRSNDEVPDQLKDQFLAHAESTQKELYQEYTKFVEAGLARELARINLPLSLYTEWYWKIDLHNLFHFLHLRLDAHAQQEIREYAEVMAGMVRAVAPVAYEAFEDYTLRAVSFSGPEVKVLTKYLDSFSESVESLVQQGLSKREAGEFLEKLERNRARLLGRS